MTLPTLNDSQTKLLVALINVKGKRRFWIFGKKCYYIDKATRIWWWKNFEGHHHVCVDVKFQGKWVNVCDSYGPWCEGVPAFADKLVETLRNTYKETQVEEQSLPLVQGDRFDRVEVE